MRRTRLLGAIVSATFLALPGAALAQSDTDVPADDNTATVVIPALPEPILADDPLTDPVDDATDPAAQDPAGLVVSDDPLTPQVETVVEDQPSDRLAPPVNDRTRWSDDRDAPRWQQDRRWRDRGIFYRWRDGWYRSERGRWWRWNSRWERCDPPPPPPRICPEPPRRDPSPTWNDGRDNGQQQGPGAPAGSLAAWRQPRRACGVHPPWPARVPRQLRPPHRAPARPAAREHHHVPPVPAWRAQRPRGSAVLPHPRDPGSSRPVLAGSAGPPPAARQ